MPVVNPEIVPNDFLREFNFSTGFQGLLKRLFGELAKPWWLNFVFSSHGRSEEHFTQRFEIAVKVNFDGHGGARFAVFPHLKDTPFRVQEISIPIIDERLCFEVPDTKVMEGSLPVAAIHTAERVLLEFGTRMYEFDPRIGCTISEANDKLPDCPLFTPRVIIPKSYDDFFTRPLQDMVHGLETPEYLVINCPLCGGAFTQELTEQPMWAGGNMFWVHGRCWSET